MVFKQAIKKKNVNGTRGPPFMANVIKNFHFVFLNSSLKQCALQANIVRIALTFGLTVATLAASIGKSSFSDRSNVHLYFSSHPVSILTHRKSLENSQ